MSGPSGERCGICYYCVDPGAFGDGLQGWCKRHPPWPQKDGEEPAYGSPAVFIGGWCGEFKLHPNMQGHLSRFRPVKFHDEDPT